MNDTTMTLIGNLVEDPVLRHTSNTNIPFVNFRVASTPRRYDREQQRFVDAQPVFLTVTAWRGLALNVADSLRKGNPVVVHGRFNQREYTQNEQLRVAYGLEAFAVGPDLSRGVTTFAKRTHGSFEPSVELDADGTPSNQGERFMYSAAASPAEEAEAMRAADAVEDFVAPAAADDFEEQFAPA